MLFEIIIILEVIAFLLLVCGIWPAQQSVGLGGNESKAPYLNKMIYIFVAAILFWSLSLLTVAYDYNYCYVNQTVSDFSLNTTTSTATCGSYTVISEDLSYLNMGMGILSIVIFIILVLFASMSKKEYNENDGLGY